MKKEQLYEILKQRIVLLDGATGTELQKRGLPQGLCPEKWILEHPETIIDIQKRYVEAGSEIVYAPTFGANRWKLEEFGLENEGNKMNAQLVALSKQAVGDRAWVAGDIAPTGQFIRPFGDKTFEETVEIYKEQAKALYDAGVDLFVIETMIDIQEARAALIAVKETCDLPVMVSMTFQEDGRTLTGSDPSTAAITLQSLGADVIGCNCSTGPKDMLLVIEQIKAVATVPVFAKPNAGLPVIKDGKTVYDLGPEPFAAFIDDFAAVGINIIGGCCGTTPEHIAFVKKKADKQTPKLWNEKRKSGVTSVRKTVTMGEKEPLVIVGERINPTGKKKMQAELKEGKMTEVKRFASEQAQCGATILDVNVGMPGIDEKQTMCNIVEMLSSMSELPLCIDSSNPEVIEAALRIYPGRALVNSISGEEKKVKELLPVVAKYGAMVIVLPLNDQEVPKEAEKRIEIIKEIAEEATKYNYGPEDFVVDGLVMTVSADQKAAAETLKVIRWASEELKTNTIMGLSNVSFGLPERTWLNGAFLTMAMTNGLNMAIANPSSERLMELKLAADVLTGRDTGSKNYIARFVDMPKTNTISVPSEEKNVCQKIYDCVVKGEKEEITQYMKKALEENKSPFEIVDDYLIPAINKVGELYDKKEYFLPQLILSAECMKVGFDYIEPMLTKAQAQKQKEKTKIIIATVKGDIHDIGKNIVALMLRNYGYEVIDLGKDVPAEMILDTVKKTDAPIVALSALMTTTMGQMKHVIDLAREEGVTTKFIVGGAVITQEYADEIRADGYSEDAMGAVRLVGELIGS